MLISSEITRREISTFAVFFYSVTRDKPFVLWYIPASRFRAPAQPAEKPSPRRCSSQPSTSWKDGRVVDCTALERRHVRLGHRGFESLSFRQIQIRCCFMQHRIFYFLQNNQRTPPYFVSLSLRRSHSHWWMFWWVSWRKIDIFSFSTVKRKSCLGVLKKLPTLSFVSSSISHKARSVKSKSLISSSASKDFMRKL